MLVRALRRTRAIVGSKWAKERGAVGKGDEADAITALLFQTGGQIADVCLGSFEATGADVACQHAAADVKQNEHIASRGRLRFDGILPPLRPEDGQGKQRRSAGDQARLEKLKRSAHQEQIALGPGVRQESTQPACFRTRAMPASRATAAVPRLASSVPERQSASERLDSTFHGVRSTQGKMSQDRTEPNQSAGEGGNDQKAKGTGPVVRDVQFACLIHASYLIDQTRVMGLRNKRVAERNCSTRRITAARASRPTNHSRNDW